MILGSEHIFEEISSLFATRNIDWIDFGVHFDGTCANVSSELMLFQFLAHFNQLMDIYSNSGDWE